MSRGTTRGLVEHTVPGRTNLPGGPDTRVDIVESFDLVIRTPACCRMTGRGRHGGKTVGVGKVCNLSSKSIRIAASVVMDGWKGH